MLQIPALSISFSKNMVLNLLFVSIRAVVKVKFLSFSVSDFQVLAEDYLLNLYFPFPYPDTGPIISACVRFDRSLDGCELSFLLRNRCLFRKVHFFFVQKSTYVKFDEEHCRCSCITLSENMNLLNSFMKSYGVVLYFLWASMENAFLNTIFISIRMF